MNGSDFGRWFFRILPPCIGERLASGVSAWATELGWYGLGVGGSPQALGWAWFAGRYTRLTYGGLIWDQKKVSWEGLHSKRFEMGWLTHRYNLICAHSRKEILLKKLHCWIDYCSSDSPQLRNRAIYAARSMLTLILKSVHVGIMGPPLNLKSIILLVLQPQKRMTPHKRKSLGSIVSFS